MIKKIFLFIILSINIYNLSPETKNDFFNKGNEYQKNNDFKNAIENYTKAIRIDNKFVEAYIERAISYSSLRDYDNALSDLDKAQVIDPNNENVYFNKGYIYESLNNISKAIENYSKVIQINSKNTRAYLVRGDLYTKTGEDKKAIDDFTKAIELQPDYIYSYGARGINYFNLEEYGLALESFNGYIKNVKWQLGIDPFDLRVLYYRAFTYIYTKDLDKSLKDWNSYLKIDAFNPYALRHRGLVFLLLNNYSKAIDDFNTAISYKDSDSRLYYLLIIASYKRSIDEYNQKLKELMPVKSKLKEDWEKSVLDFFVDKITGDELLSKVENKYLKLNIYCYIGYKYLINNNKEMAKSYFKKCFETGKSAPIEYILTLHEYEKL